MFEYNKWYNICHTNFLLCHTSPLVVSLNVTITIFLQTEIILKSSSNVDGHNNVNSSKYAYVCRKPCFKNSPNLILWIQKLNSIKYNSSRTGKLFPWDSFKVDFTDFNKTLWNVHLSDSWNCQELIWKNWWWKHTRSN